MPKRGSTPVYKTIPRAYSDYSKMARAIVRHQGFDWDTVNSKTRKREVVFCRQLVFYFGHKFYNSKISLAAMGSVFRKDHSTVLHAKRVVQNLIDTDRNYRSLVDDVENFIKHQFLPDIKMFDDSTIPKNEIQRISQENRNLTRLVNQMYYTCLSYLEQLNSEIQEDKILEGFRAKRLDQKYYEAKKVLQRLKHNSFK